MIERPRQSTLLVPVPKAEPMLKRWRETLTSSGLAGMPAHITLLYPFLSPEEIDEEVVDELQALFSGVPPIEFRLAATGRFPDTLYLTPEPAEPFLRLVAALSTLYPDHPPYQGIHQEVLPHVTVAHAQDEETLARIEAQLPACLPIEAVADEAWLMEEDSSYRWRVAHRFLFA